ncbi:response regulator [Patescibacteria group bacterium]|nr:response regulator [Patescibacteria group bacterium]
MILRTYKIIFRSPEYRMIIARSGDQALQLHQEHLSRGEHFDLVMTDLDLPDIPGTSLSLAIRAKEPSAKIIVVSGYVQDKAMVQPSDYGFFDKIEKPFDLGELKSCVHKALHTP